jgi:hypothetical protein
MWKFQLQAWACGEWANMFKKDCVHANTLIPEEGYYNSFVSKCLIAWRFLEQDSHLPSIGGRWEAIR